MPYNIFSDASIDLNINLACAGFLVMDDRMNEVYRYHVLQANATNNSAEILALLMAIDYGAQNCNNPGWNNFRVFSDSRISVMGIRDWMFNWIGNMNKCKGTALINGSGKPVANQGYFIHIFQSIIANNVNFRLFHNDGHINSEMDKIKAKQVFVRENGIEIERLGLSINDIAMANNSIDASTRDAIYNRKPGDIIIDTRYTFPTYLTPDEDMVNRYFKLLGF